MFLLCTGLHPAPCGAFVYEVYSLVGEDGEPVRREHPSAFHPLLDSPGWRGTIAALGVGGGAVRYVVEAKADGCASLRVKVACRPSDPLLPVWIPVAAPTAA